MEANRYMRSTVLGIVATKAVEPVLKFKAPTPTPASKIFGSGSGSNI